MASTGGEVSVMKRIGWGFERGFIARNVLFFGEPPVWDASWSGCLSLE